MKRLAFNICSFKMFKSCVCYACLKSFLTNEIYEKLVFK